MSDTVTSGTRPENYFEEGRSWERNIVARDRRSKGLAWTITVIMSAIAISAVGAVVMLTPLKSYEPYMVVVDRSTGFVEVKRPMAEGAPSQDEAVTMFNLVRYVRSREIYDPKALKENFDLAQLLSYGDASRELTEIFSPANPQNPVKIFGRNTVIAVNIKSVTFPNARTALVRFSTEEKSQTNIVTRHWISLIRFRYTNTPATNEFRFDNPLGFQVLEYRRDQETAPSPGTMGNARS